MYYSDAICPNTNRYELFMFFYNNRFKKPSASNPWRRNLAKLIFPEVYVDVDLLKALIASYIHAKKSFHKQDRNVLCRLDHASFIEAFGLEGQMSVEVDIQDFREKFQRNVKFYTGNVMIHHIPYELKLDGDIPKKVDKMIPMNKFCNYLQNTIYDLHKALETDGSDVVYGGPYLMALNIQDPFTNVEYDYVKYIIKKCKNKLELSREENLEISNSTIIHY